MKKWLTLGLEQGKCKMSLEHGVGKKIRRCSKCDGDMPKDTETTAERIPTGQIQDQLQNKKWEEQITTH